MLVDSHAHLQWKSFSKDREEVIERAREAGVETIINIGFDLDGSREAIRLAEEHEDLFASVGIHPHNASHLDESALDELKRLSQNRKVVAVGETGLDYYRNLSPKEAQKEAFEAQLNLAQELGLPVVIHSRDATADVLSRLKEHEGEIQGVMHCFSGSREVARQCIKLGFYISFVGSVTFPNAARLRKIAKSIDLSRVLLETDSPWLAPQEVRGLRNEPSFLVLTAKKIAELRGSSLEKLGDITTENAKNLFRLP